MSDFDDDAPFEDADEEPTVAELAYEELTDDELADTEFADDEVAESRERHPAGAAALARRVAMDRPARIAVASLVLVAMMFLFVFPTSSYLAQQRQVRSARHSVAVLRAQNAQLAREAKRLQTPVEIERLARAQFNMVFPGEQAYNVVPPRGVATTTTTTP